MKITIPAELIPKSIEIQCNPDGSLSPLVTIRFAISPQREGVSGRESIYTYSNFISAALVGRLVEEITQGVEEKLIKDLSEDLGEE